jgi:hypothetical protein
MAQCAGAGKKGEGVFRADIEGDVPSAVFFDLSGLAPAGGNHRALVAELDQLATKLDGSALDPALIQFRK